MTGQARLDDGGFRISPLHVSSLAKTPVEVC